MMRVMLHAAFTQEVKERLAEDRYTCTRCAERFQPTLSTIVAVAVRRSTLVGSTYCPHCRAYQTLYVTYVRTRNAARRGLTALHA